MDDARLLTVAEVAERLSCSTHQVYRRISRGDIKAQQIMRRQLQYRISEAELERYIAAGGGLTAPVPARDMMRVPEVAQRLGFTVETVRRLCYQGRLPYVRGAGEHGHLRIPRAAVDDFIAGDL